MNYAGLEHLTRAELIEIIKDCDAAINELNKGL